MSLSVIHLHPQSWSLSASSVLGSGTFSVTLPLPETGSRIVVCLSPRDREDFLWFLAFATGESSYVDCGGQILLPFPNSLKVFASKGRKFYTRLHDAFPQQYLLFVLKQHYQRGFFSVPSPLPFILWASVRSRRRAWKWLWTSLVSRVLCSSLNSHLVFRNSHFSRNLPTCLRGTTVFLHISAPDKPVVSPPLFKMPAFVLRF